jgi:hypothetical protein
VSRIARVVLVTVGAMAGLILWIDLLIWYPTTAAIAAAVALAFLDWWRRRRRLQVRKDDE